ncbi:MAG: D-alanine--D-alanine ligase [Firmicutes bacterium]|nr:D-alanine--D-alanine ligase [Bacillota bacterium]
MKKRVAVLKGGTSAEREVSLRSGQAVYQALLEAGYDAYQIDVDATIGKRLLEDRPEVAFIALHGALGEDGTMQGLLEILGIPYTGPGVLASALGLNKLMAKKVFCFEGIPTPPFVVVNQKEARTAGVSAVVERVVSQLSLPVVVKPVTQGSTIGISFVHEAEKLEAALELAFSYDPQVLIEKMISGVEVTSSILGDDPPLVLPLIEIYSVTGVYDYETKYTPGMSDHIIPPRIPEEQQERAKQACLRAYQALGCRGLSRVDCIVDPEGNPFVLEVNTAPGMTATSLFPDAARAAGIGFPELVSRLVEMARNG